MFCDRFGVTEPGNFEGATVLTVDATIPALAEDYDMAESEVENRLETAREQVFEARSERPRPARDEKILASWNGLMISAFAEGALVIGDEDLADTATTALDFVRDHLWDAEDGRLSRRYKDGDVQVDGYLEDYAFLAHGAFDLYQATGEVANLRFALDLARTIDADFWDADAGTLYFTPADGEQLVARPQELTEQSTPASAGVAAELLLALDHFVPDDGFTAIAQRVLETHGQSIESNPLQHASLVLAADQYASGGRELTIAAEELSESWRAAIGETYLPARICSVRPPTTEGLAEWLETLELGEAPPIWADREQRDDEPTVYACQQFTCSPLGHDIQDALDWFDTEDR